MMGTPIFLARPTLARTVSSSAEAPPSSASGVTSGVASGVASGVLESRKNHLGPFLAVAAAASTHANALNYALGAHFCSRSPPNPMHELERWARRTGAPDLISRSILRRDG
ncbi:hypothetical protein E4U42_000798 [Claviceps africana]|uniref:Uncharacterized protein n=1 Tax=Claviceps africana TaxID=83212 RepID=A0A8K0NN47_9HYPO|nr:hypothetical protein E4U42_000798 [Claviceps africana]